VLVLCVALVGDLHEMKWSSQNANVLVLAANALADLVVE
jgi:hypothetical protein